MEIVDNRALLVNTKYPDKITDAIEKSAVVDIIGDIHQVLVHWDLHEATTLATMVKNVPSPVKKEYNYPGRHKPFAHQETTTEFLTIRKKAFCFNEQGLGKTASAIWAADYLMLKKLVRRVLVICPMSIMKAAWQADLFTFAVHRSCDIAYGDRDTRRRIIRGNAEFVIINPDGVDIVKDAVIEDGRFDLIIVDEATAYKNIMTKRWKALRKLVGPNTRLWMMTGTPAAQSPVDAYGLAKLVNPDGIPKFLGQFRDSVLAKVSQFRWVPRPNAERIVHSALQPAIRFEKKDCLDLPPVLSSWREAPLTAQQMRYYKQLKKDMAISADGEEVTAANAAVNMNKLLQISCGAVYTDEQGVLEFDVSNRLAVVEEVIRESSYKVLVFVPFSHTLSLLRDHLSANDITCDIVNGSVSMNKRSEIFRRFQTEANPRVLLMQPQAVAHGLTLTAANVIVWYAPVTSVETYLQANARIDRPGQKNDMTVVHIYGSEVEQRVYSMLRNNINNHGKIIDLYRDEIKST